MGRFRITTVLNTFAVTLFALAAVSLIGTLAPSEASAGTKWLCKPGNKTNPCKVGLKTTVFDTAGNSTIEKPKNAKKPKYDCFYVYPTVSEQLTVNANKQIDPEQTTIARYQAARFSENCRVFAPVYRQLTLAGIQDPGTVTQEEVDLAYNDVRAAWRTYLKKFNKGRGVVLIGHSQGTLVLGTLLAQEIEKKKSQRKKLISALIIGYNVSVKKGSDKGGTFKRIRTCDSAKQTRCVIAYSTYNAPPPVNATFGRTSVGFNELLPAGADPNDYEVACTNPSALGGGSGKLKSLYRSEPFPGTLGLVIETMFPSGVPTAATPWLTPQDHYRSECVNFDGANVLMVSPIDGAQMISPSPLFPTWGLHLVDVNLGLGNLVNIVRKQGKQYLKKH